jgi:hypothetical protein
MLGLLLIELKTFIEKYQLIFKITATQSRFRKLLISYKSSRNRNSSKKKRREMEKPKSQSL